MTTDPRVQANGASSSPDMDLTRIQKMCAELKIELMEERRKTVNLYCELREKNSLIEKQNEEIERFLEEEDFYLREIYDFKQAVFPRLLYFVFRAYKFLTARSSSITVMDKIFRENHVPLKYRKHGRLRAFYNLIKFAILNPRIALRNATPGKLKIIFRKLFGNKVDLTQWLDARIPISGRLQNLVIEKYEMGEVIEFPKNSSVSVSIIVPVFNNIEITLSLLKSIEKYTDVSYEVIVADDFSDDETQYIGEFVKNAIHVRNDKNLGFLKNCNNAAGYARGEFLVFLNNDTNVGEGWLSAILRAFNSEEVGVVGPKILFEDGSLQEAGGIIWRDGSGWNYGRSQDPEKPEFNYLKEVDYVSGCCLTIRKSLWEEIGGFDERFVPAYYEDTDICFEARARGYKVIYQPQSCIMHLEGASHGVSTSSGVKKYQVANQRKFREKWTEILERHNVNAQDVFRSRDRSLKKPCILFIDHYVPWYDKDAGSRAVFMYLGVVLEMGFNVKFIGDNFYRHEPYTSTLQQMGIEVLYGNYYAANIEGWIRENFKAIDVVFLNRPHISERYIDLIESLGLRIIYFGHDLHFLRLQRQSQLEGSKKLSQEAIRWKERELDIISKSDVVYYPSSVEVDILRKECGVNSVKTLPLFSYPQSEFQESTYDPSQRSGAIFVGGFGHPPNVDAVEWLYSEIYPGLSKESLPIYIVGSSVPEKIQQISCKDFQVLGYLSDDELTELYKNVKVAVVPLRFGAGVKGKVLEAMFHAVPVVGTSIALEGIESVEAGALQCDTPSGITNTLNNVCRNVDALIEMSQKSREFIEQRYSAENLKNVFLTDLLGEKDN